MKYTIALLALSFPFGANAQQFEVKIAPVFSVKHGVCPCGSVDSDCKGLCFADKGQCACGLKKVKVAPSAGSHKCMVCEGNGCGCGCRSGAQVCVCHPGWRPSSDGWWFYRQGGREIGAFKDGNYWRKQDGRWVEWIEKKEVRLEPRTFRSGRSC